MDPEIRSYLALLDDRTRRIQADTAAIRSRLNRLQLKVATLAGVVSTIIAFLAFLFK